MRFSDNARAILERPLLAVVSTIRSDGSPHSVPVWFRLDGESIEIWSGEHPGWVQNVRTRPQVGLTVCDTRDRFSGAVVIHGVARIDTGDDESISRQIRKITKRYLEESHVDEYIDRFPKLRTIVTIEATSVAAWKSAE
jgi:PPOX class probable F420-dependent enzyme